MDKSKAKTSKCNAPGCKKPAGGFLCKEHSKPLPLELKKAVRRIWKETPDHMKATHRPFILLTALSVSSAGRQ